MTRAGDLRHAGMSPCSAETLSDQRLDITAAGLTRRSGLSALALCQRPAAFTLARVRLTEFWERMRAQFGDAYAESVARDYVLSTLGSRTVKQALADGEDTKTVWRAVCEAFRVPERLR